MILYVETTFLLGAVTGRDASVIEVLKANGHGLEVALPSVCVMEARCALEGELKRYGELQSRLEEHVSQVRRCMALTDAPLLVEALQSALGHNAKVRNELATGLDLWLRRLAGLEREFHPVTLLEADLPVLRSSLPDLATDEPEWLSPRDELILQTILQDASRRPGRVKTLLSANTRDFNSPAVRELRARVGIERYCASCSDFIGWFRAADPGA